MKSENIKLIIGLGNPGILYENTPHNIGNHFVKWFFDKALKEKIGNKIIKWKNNKNLSAKIASLEIHDSKIILALPSTFMNLSGNAIQKILNFYHIDSKEIIIAHDDADLVSGNFKLTYSCSSAGHKGIESTIHHLGTQNFWRLKIGVRPENLNESLYRIKAGDFVIKKMTIKNRKIISDSYLKMLEELIRWIKNT